MLISNGAYNGTVPLAACPHHHYFLVTTAVDALHLFGLALALLCTQWCTIADAFAFVMHVHVHVHACAYVHSKSVLKDIKCCLIEPHRQMLHTTETEF
jgi:hypothetical protein